MNYLDLKTLLVDDIAGGSTAFIFLSLLLISYICIKFRMPNSITLTMFAVYGVVISVFFQSVMAITILIVGIMFSFAIVKLFQR